MSKVAHACEYHRKSMLVRSGNDFVVADRAAGFDNRTDSGCRG